MPIQTQYMPSEISGNSKATAVLSICKRNKFISYSIIIAMFILAGFILYANTIHAPFIYDDIRNIMENEYIRMTDLSADQIRIALNAPGHRPITMISFALNYYFDQYNPAGYHLVNILIHITTGIFLFFFLKITLDITRRGSNSQNGNYPVNTAASGNAMLLSFFAALLWIVHPLHTQSVTFIVQRMNSMAAMFYMLSILCYINGRARQTRFSGAEGKITLSKIKATIWFTGCLVSELLALANKQNAAMLPFFIILYEWFFFQDLKWTGSKNKLLWGSLLFLILAAIAVFFINHYAVILSMYDRHNFTMFQRLLTETRVLAYYISLIFFPHPSRLHLDYNYPISTSPADPATTFICMGVIAGLLALSVISAKKNRLMAFSTLWFFGNLAIESTFLGLAPIFEHRTYLPSMMPLFLFSMGLFKFIKIKYLRNSICSLLIIFLSMWTFQRNIIWQDDISFWQDDVKKTPDKANSYNNLAYVLMNNTNYTQAIKNLKTAILLNPQYAEAHHNLGAAYHALGNNQQAIYHYQQAIKQEPSLFKTYYNLGRIYYETGEFQTALNTFKKALDINQNHSEVLNAIGLVLKSQNHPDQAINYFEKAIKGNDKFISAYVNWGTILAAMGKTDEAQACYLRALALAPDNVEILNNLGNLAAKNEQYNEAIDYYTRALEINPAHTITMNNMGNALLAVGKFNEALPFYVMVQEINPENPENHYKIASVYAAMKNFKQAAVHFSEALRIDPQYVKAQTSLNRIHQNLNSQTANIQNKIQQETNNAILHYQQGNKYKQNNDFDRAIIEFQTALSLEPKLTNALFNLAVVYAMNKDDQKSIETFKRILKIDPKNAAVAYNIACIYSRQNNKDKAIVWLQKAIRLGYDNWDMIRTDTDLENIRSTEYYRQLQTNP